MRDVGCADGPHPEQRSRLGAMWEKHLGALITGITAVAAAAIVALVTASSSSDVVRQEGRRATVRADEAARGAARVLMGEFLVVGEELEDWIGNGFLIPFGPDFPVRIDSGELQAIAARVTPRQWNYISRALAA